MGSTLDTLVVVGIVVVAAGYLIRKYTTNKPGSGCGCGCSCEHASTCNSSDSESCGSKPSGPDLPLSK